MTNDANPKVLVTGANGYIGSHVVRALAERIGCKVVAVDFSNGARPPDVEFKNIDILARAEDESLYPDLGEPSAIVHLAWKDGFKHNSEAHLGMLPRHYAFLRNMHMSGCKNVSVMGSMHEVGFFEGGIDDRADVPCNPVSLYGIAKNALRQAMFAYSKGTDLKLKWLRGYYITGDEERSASILGKILAFAKEGRATFPFTDGKNKYDFIDVDTLAYQIACAAVQTEELGVINVCSGRPQALKDVVEDFISRNKLSIRPEYGAFPSRPCDSPCVYGLSERINKIVRDFSK